MTLTAHILKHIKYANDRHSEGFEVLCSFTSNINAEKDSPFLSLRIVYSQNL